MEISTDIIQLAKNKNIISVYIPNAYSTLSSSWLNNAKRHIHNKVYLNMKTYTDTYEVIYIPRVFSQMPRITVKEPFNADNYFIIYQNGVMKSEVDECLKSIELEHYVTGLVKVHNIDKSNRKYYFMILYLLIIFGVIYYIYKIDAFLSINH